jgi:cell division protein FtsN
MFGLGYSAGKNRVVPVEDLSASTLSKIDAKASLHDEIKKDVDIGFYKSLVEKEEKQRPKSDVKVETARLEPVPSAVPVKADKPSKPVVAAVEAPKAAAPVTAPKAPPAVEDAALANIVENEPELREPPPPVRDVPVKEAPAPKLGSFTIQVSAFKTQPEAASYVKLLTAKGFPANIKASTVEGKGTWYRVRVGSFTSKQAADSYKDKLTRDNLPAWVVKAD